MRKKIIAVSVVFAVLAMLCTQSVAAAKTVEVYAWTDKSLYDPGDKGKLKISVLNTMDDPISIRNISITYPWKVYDANTNKWVGNETITIEPVATVSEKGGDYYKEVNFEIPNDGRAITATLILPGTPDSIEVVVGMNIGTKSASAKIAITAPSLPTSFVGLDTWITTAGVFILICTIILAIAIFLAAGRARPRAVALPPRRRPETE